MSADRTTTRPFDHLVYVRVFEGCNLECKHCFIPSNPKKMSLEDVWDVPNKLAAQIPLGSRVLLQWHGGEPTLLGASYLREAIEGIEKDKRFVWLHGIQTNLMTYDKEWTPLYQDWFEGEVGVSWDPKIRRVRGGEESLKNQKFESIFWPNLTSLVQDGLSPYLVVTATRALFETYPNPTILFDRLTEAGVTHAHLERLTKTGYARQSWAEIGVNNAEYSRWMSKWYRAYRLWNETHPERRLALSPFDGLELEVVKLKGNKGGGGYGCWSGKCDTTFHTIDGSGYKAGCTAVTSEVDNQSSEHNQKIQWFGTVPKSLQKAREKRKAPCESCEFKTICNTGCLASDKVDESDECSGASRLFEEIRSRMS
jgi:radical SAM protein with 4Fe4S-binding SPASM domain